MFLHLIFLELYLRSLNFECGHLQQKPSLSGLLGGTPRVSRLLSCSFASFRSVLLEVCVCGCCVPLWSAKVKGFFFCLLTFSTYLCFVACFVAYIVINFRWGFSVWRWNNLQLLLSPVDFGCSLLLKCLCWVLVGKNCHSWALASPTLVLLGCTWSFTSFTISFRKLVATVFDEWIFTAIMWSWWIIPFL